MQVCSKVVVSGTESDGSQCSVWLAIFLPKKSRKASEKAFASKFLVYHEQKRQLFGQIKRICVEYDSFVVFPLLSTVHHIL